MKFGENIVITGRDLTVVDMSNQVSVSMVCKDGKRKYDCWSIDDMIEHTPTRIVVPFPAEFKREDFWKQSMMRFEFSTDSGKPSGPYRTIKYKHGVKVAFD